MNRKEIATWLGMAVSVITICAFLQSDAASRQKQATTEEDHWRSQQEHEVVIDHHLDTIDDKISTVQTQGSNTSGKVDVIMRFMGARPPRYAAPSIPSAHPIVIPDTNANTKKNEHHSRVDAPQLSKSSKMDFSTGDLKTDSWK